MTMRFRSSFVLGAGLLAIPPAHVARATVFMSEDQAAFEMFPGRKLDARWVDLSAEEIKQIEKASGENVRSSRVRVWQGKSGEAVFIDQVVGKHEFITIAVGVAPGGKVKQVEILEYKETYGGEVRGPEWRQQFVGKDPNAPLKINHDIKNISGATLSSVHVTAGVRRLLQTYEVLQAQPDRAG